MARPAKNSKPMSNAERQRQYRLRKKLDLEAREYRLNTFIDEKADTALRLLASHYGLSQKAMLEKLIKDAHVAIADSMEPGSERWRQYFQPNKVRNGDLI